MSMTWHLAQPVGATRLLRRLAATILASLALLGQPALAAPPQVEAVEPPHWWVGMAERRLQLLVYGQGIVQARVRVQGTGLALEVWLPRAGDWNGKVQQVGNGGFAGQVPVAGLYEHLLRGYAVAGTDGGHRAPDGMDASWALRQPQTPATQMLLPHAAR